MADPKKDRTPPGDAPEEKESPEYQFGDDQVESSWFRRAVAAGLRYTKARSERSGVKILPVLDLEVDESLPSFKPQVKGAPPPPQPQPQKKPQPPQQPQPQPQPRHAPKAKVQDDPYDPKPRGAFAGGGEKTLFKTAINQFLDYQAQKRATQSVRQVRLMQSGAMIGDESSGIGRLLVKVIAIALLGVFAYGAYKIISVKIATASRVKYNRDIEEPEDDDLLQTETVIKPKSKRPSNDED